MKLPCNGNTQKKMIKYRNIKRIPYFSTWKFTSRSEPGLVGASNNLTKF